MEDLLFISLNEDNISVIYISWAVHLESTILTILCELHGEKGGFSWLGVENWEPGTNI